MPERIVTRRTIIGGGKKGDRRDLMPGQVVNLPDDQIAELERRGVVQTRRAYERQAREAEGGQGSELQERRVAEPVGAAEKPPGAADAGNDASGNITRDAPTGGQEEL